MSKLGENVQACVKCDHHDVTKNEIHVCYCPEIPVTNQVMGYSFCYDNTRENSSCTYYQQTDSDLTTEEE